MFRHGKLRKKQEKYSQLPMTKVVGEDRNALSVPLPWRNIVEMTSMLNNDEYVFYTKEEIFHADLAKYVSSGFYDKPSLRVSRRVQQCEIDSGLDPTFKSYRANEVLNIPFLTEVLDQIEVIKSDIVFYKKLVEHSNKKKDWASMFLANLVGSNYYDCMSSCMPGAMMLAIHYIVDKYPNIDLSTTVYPGKDKTTDAWYTLYDFIESTKMYVSELNSKLDSPKIIKFLSENF